VTHPVRGWHEQLLRDERNRTVVAAFLLVGLFTAVESWAHLKFEVKTTLALGLLAGITAALAAKRWGPVALAAALVASWLIIALYSTYGL